MVLYRNLIQKAALKYGINPDLIAAIILKESSFNTDAMRYEPGYRWLFRPEVFAKNLGITLDSETVMQSCSWGLMQVMGAVAREAGFAYPLFKLTRPDFGINAGTGHLAQYLKRYGKVEDALAAYNGGGGAILADGSFKNQDYVDSVMGHYKRGVI